MKNRCFFRNGVLFIILFLLLNGNTILSFNTKIISNSLSNNYVRCINEDSHGYIWIGTERGLNRYNGSEYRQYFNRPGDSTTISYDMIINMTRDSRKRLWICTVNGINLYTDQDNFKSVPIVSPNINAERVLETSTGKIWANVFIGLAKYDERKGNFQQVLAYNDFYISSLADKYGRIWIFSNTKVKCINELLETEAEFTLPRQGEFISAYLDDSGKIWIMTENGTYVINSFLKKFEPLPEELRENKLLAKSTFATIHRYNDKLLISTFQNGLFLYDPESRSVIHQSEDNFPFRAPDYMITGFFTDSGNNLWFRSNEHGLGVIYNSRKLFNYDNLLKGTFNSKSIVSFFEDKSCKVWIATRLEGIYIYDLKKKVIKHIISKELPVYIDRFYLDSQNNVWIMSLKDLYCFTVNGDNLIFKHRYHLGYYVITMCEDRYGTIWLGTGSEKLYYKKRTDKDFSFLQLYKPGYNFINVLKPLSDGKIFVLGFNKSPVLIDPLTMSKESVPIYNEQLITRIVPICLYEDSEHFIWIGTKSSGVYKYDRERKIVENLGMKDGLPCDAICSICEDMQGNMWLGTYNGIAKYDRTNSRFYSWYEEDGIGGNQFNDRAILRLSDNNVMIGGIHGLTFFNPVDVSVPRNIPIYFEDFYVFKDNNVYSLEEISKSRKYVGNNPDIVLKHNENSIIIMFTALQFNEYSKVNYSYKMEGLDLQWIKNNKVRQAYYSKLPPGKYKFRARVDNHFDSDLVFESVLNIRVKRNPLLSITAIILYIIAGVFLLYYILKLYVENRTDRAKALLKEKEISQIKKINEMNMNFFTNMSHEFRTPLTMISGPVNQLMKNEKADPDTKYLLSVINRSVVRMLTLINQILDFRRLEDDAVKLQVEKNDIIKELNKILDIFRFNFEEKSIKLLTIGMIDTYFTWLDSDKLDKIMTNLLSNALKFTPEGGRVIFEFDIIDRKMCEQMFPKASVSVSECEYICIKVRDSGRGFSETSKDMIFERYFVDITYKEGLKNWSSGIGLYYTRRLVNLHHGFIKAENSIDGGAILTFVLPVSDAFYTDNEKITKLSDDLLLKPLVHNDYADEILTSPSHGDNSSFEFNVLVVEDDTEVSGYLKYVLSEQYNVTVRHNANDLINHMDEINPNLIISDILMPGTDGLLFCRQIKENSSYCHIPVILLTAKVSVEDQVEGLNIGADAYVTKPFEPDYLLALVRSLLNNRRKLQNLLLGATSIRMAEAEESVGTLSTLDKHFMDKLFELMERELSNPELNIMRLSNHLKMGRTKLYYKIKGLTGETPNIFFNRYKLNRAVEMLKSGKFNVSEVADLTGFKTSSHFSTVFKKQFGVSPTKYL